MTSKFLNECVPQERKRLQDITTTSKIFLPNTKANILSATLRWLSNTYPFNRSISLKLPFDPALSCLIILKRENIKQVGTQNYYTVPRKLMQRRSTTHKPSHKQSFIWISRNNWVVIRIICINCNIKISKKLPVL